MSKLSILVVEDDPFARRLMGSQLESHQVDFAEDAGSARRKIESGGHQICFIDLILGKGDEASGLELIPLAKAKGAYSVVMSAEDSQDVIDRAYSLGCDDFYAKGNERSNVGSVLARYNTKRRKEDLDSIYRDRFMTEDEATRADISKALEYAASDLPVLILGPSGTGKTNLARIIHDMSNRKGQFVAINCSAYTEDLLEAELFGHKKGAFTGAAESRKGKLALAHEGTLFLDEIGSMSLAMQTKLLKAIEERTFYPVGSEEPQTSDFRIVSATLEDLQRLIKLGKLRFDFFQRIHGLTIALKPLAQRKCDIFPLLSYFSRGERRLSFTPEAKDFLLRHDWPGNVRELKKLVSLLVAGPEGRIGAEALKKLFASISVEDGPASIVTEDIYHYALKHGLIRALEKIAAGVIGRNLRENDGIKNRVLADLKISNRLYYSSLKRGPASAEDGGQE